MYGLIHRAIRGYIMEQHGPEMWTKIAMRTGVDESAFISMQGYPDEITLSLLGGASEVLQEDLSELLLEFGRYWVLKTARVEYGPLFEFAGNDMVSFLGNLNAMHEQVAITFENLQQPSFMVQGLKDNRLLLHYESPRDGLTPFVVGLITGLAEHFGENVDIKVVEEKSVGADHDVFEVSFLS